jgi:mitotic spindle assembly checkpoint protein MAD2B
MAAPPPAPPQLKNQHSLLCALTDFLTVALHTILFVRNLYPASTFITTRKYNLPVHQNRHPAVCAWINNAVSSIHDLLLKSTVSRIIVVVYSADAEVMERYLFDVSRFPIVEKKLAWVEFEERPGDVKGKGKEVDNGQGAGKDINIVDIEEQLRATIRKLEYTGSKMDDLPQGCTYTVAVELRDTPEAAPPIGHPQPWVPSEPSLQTGHKGRSERIGTDLGGVKSRSVRLVEAGEFIMESWIEEGKAKFSSSAGTDES